MRRGNLPRNFGGIVGRLNRQISAEAERLGELVEAMDALNACRSERSLATHELLKTAQEFQKLSDELTAEIAKEDPEMAEQLKRSARSMVLNIEEAAAIPWPEPKEDPNPLP